MQDLDERFARACEQACKPFQIKFRRDESIEDENGIERDPCIVCVVGLVHLDGVVELLKRETDIDAAVPGT